MEIPVDYFHDQVLTQAIPDLESCAKKIKGSAKHSQLSQAMQNSLINHLKWLSQMCRTNCQLLYQRPALDPDGFPIEEDLSWYSLTAAMEGLGAHNQFNVVGIMSLFDYDFESPKAIQEWDHPYVPPDNSVQDDELQRKKQRTSVRRELNLINEKEVIDEVEDDSDDSSDYRENKLEYFDDDMNAIRPPMDGFGINDNDVIENAEKASFDEPDVSSRNNTILGTLFNMRW
jgi:hypothetical protein